MISTRRALVRIPATCLAVLLGSTLASAKSLEGTPALCGHGKPKPLDLHDAAADASAVVFGGHVVGRAVRGDEYGFEERTGTIDVEIETALRSPVSTGRVSVPGWAERCVPKAACPPSVFDIATNDAEVLVACVVPKKGPPRTAIVASDERTVAEMRQCITIATATDATAREAALVSAYLDPKSGSAHPGTSSDAPGLARTCAGRFVCDPRHRDEAAAALAVALRSRLAAPETKLEIALALSQTVSASAALLGCTTPSLLFDVALGGNEPTNRLVVRTILGAMVVDENATRRKRWANLLWGAISDWSTMSDDRARVLHGLDPQLAARAVKALRALGGPDGPHHETLAQLIAAANMP